MTAIVRFFVGSAAGERTSVASIRGLIHRFCVSFLIGCHVCGGAGGKAAIPGLAAFPFPENGDVLIWGRPPAAFAGWAYGADVRGMAMCPVISVEFNIIIWAQYAMQSGW